MRIGTCIGIFLVGAYAVSAADAADKTYLVGLNAIVGGSCASFGGGWQDAALDGGSGIRFCKKLSNSKPSPHMGIIDINGVFPGANVSCSSGLGNDWSEFAWDKHANIRYCMKSGDVDSSDSYIADVNAVVGGSATCLSLAGHGWDPVVHNGKSNFTMCAQFK